MGKAVTNSTYTFTPQPHGIFNQVLTDPKLKVSVVTYKKGGKR